MLTIETNLDKLYACRKDAGYCGSVGTYGSEDRRDIYVFKIFEAKLQERHWPDDDNRYTIFIRGEHTCWMEINSFIFDEDETSLLEFVEHEHRKKLLETRSIEIRYDA